jgi:hypothetical protein
MTEAEIHDIVLNFLNSLKQVRLNELPPYSVEGDPLSNNDIIGLFRNDTSKTVQINLQTLKAFMVNSSSEVIDPDKLGASIVVIASPAEIGTDTFNIPSLAGKQFVLRRNKEGTLKFADGDDGPKQYEILSSGGFKLLPEGNTIQELDQFELQLADEAGNIEVSTKEGVLFNGVMLVPTSVVLNASNHMGKLIRLRPSAAGVVVTLPDIDDVPENTIVVMEAMINCSTEVKINTTGGQYIYFNGTSNLDVSMRLGEYIFFEAGVDGWYVFSAAPGLYTVGDVSYGFATKINEVEFTGQQIAIASIGRAWKMIQTQFTVVDEATWATPAAYFYAGAWTTTLPPVGSDYITVEKPYRGCFAFDTGQEVGTEKVRMPDFRDTTIRTLGTDALQRYFNQPGGFQKFSIESHNHVKAPWNKAGAKASDIDGQGTPGSLDGGGGGQEFRVGDLTNPMWAAATITAYGGSETRGSNIGLLTKMKI